MNVFIVAVCVNLVTLVNTAHDVNFDTVLKILKQKHRKSGYSNTDETKKSIEALRIIPGFHLQKPKDSKSLFENPKTWPDDLFGNLSGEDTKTRLTKTRIGTTDSNKRYNYLKGKIFKAIKNLNKYRDNQIKNNKKTTKTKTHTVFHDDLMYKKDILKKSKAYVAQKEPVKKLLGRIFQGIQGGIEYGGKGKYKKPQNQNNEKKLGKLLKNFLHGNINDKESRGREKNYYRYDETEEKRQNTGDLLGSFVNAIQSNRQGQGSEINQRPSMLIISSASLHDNKYENENNAKESMEVSNEEYDGFDSLNMYHTRRNAKPDIGSKMDIDSDASSASSDYERNPGNPFTIHKNKYKQNWPYNHYMDGDHMNINPFGPKFGSLGPTGPELFFGRKWWYFNQDDYKPMG